MNSGALADLNYRLGMLQKEQVIPSISCYRTIESFHFCMARFLPELGAAKAAELDPAWREHTAAWARQRLLVLRLVAQHELTAAQIAAAAGVARSTVFRYLDKFLAGGVLF